MADRTRNGDGRCSHSYSLAARPAPTDSPEATRLSPILSRLPLDAVGSSWPRHHTLRLARNSGEEAESCGARTRRGGAGASHQLRRNAIGSTAPLAFSHANCAVPAICSARFRLLEHQLRGPGKERRLDPPLKVIVRRNALARRSVKAAHGAGKVALWVGECLAMTSIEP